MNIDRKFRVEVTQDMKDEMIRLKKEGFISGCIADTLGVNVSTVYKYTREYHNSSEKGSENYKARKKKEQIVIDSIKCGFSMKQASIKANTTINNVERICKRHKLKVRADKMPRTDRQIEIENNRIILEELKKEEMLSYKRQLELEKIALKERFECCFKKGRF